MFPEIPGTVRTLPKTSSQHESSSIHHHCSSNLNLTLKKEVPLNPSLQNVSYCHKSFNAFTATFLRARKCWKIQENVLRFCFQENELFYPRELSLDWSHLSVSSDSSQFVWVSLNSHLAVKGLNEHLAMTDRQTKSTKPGLPAGSAMFYCNIWQDKCTVYATHASIL